VRKQDRLRFQVRAAYAARKAGLIGLTPTLAAGCGPQTVRVNAILPAAGDTEMYRGMNNTAGSQRSSRICMR
jgi:NAD(P)-dependent dehydrogenase (short-subunit alcohol dehydrogenase family)